MGKAIKKSWMVSIYQIQSHEGFGLIVVRKFSQQKVSGKCQEPSGYICENVIACNNGILLPKLFQLTVRKNHSSDRKKTPEQFIQTVKGQNHFW
jgi:hypothetical protein